MSYKTVFNFLLIFPLGFILFSCNNFSKNESGLEYKFLYKSKSKELPEVGNFLQIKYSITNSKDSVIYSNFYNQAERILLTTPTHAGGDIMEALSMMSIGDSAQFLINADSFYLKSRYGDELPSYVKTGSKLKFLIKLQKILSQYEKDSLDNIEKITRWTNEIKEINKFVKDEGYEMRIDTVSGIRYQFHEIKSDSAKKAYDRCKVKFHLIGKMFDGTEFFNSYTSGQIQVITLDRSQIKPIGIYDAIIKMKSGEKMSCILPFDLAFGAKGIDGIIPPFSPLLYEIYVLKIE